MADAKQDAQDDAGSGEKKVGLLENKVVLLGVIVVVQAVLAIGLTQFVLVPKLQFQDPALAAMNDAAGQDLVDYEPGIIVGLEELIITLQSDDDIPSYLRIEVNLEVVDQAAADQVMLRLPQLRDTVILALSNKRARELTTPEGNLAARAEIMRKLAEKLPPGALCDIYFSELVIQ
ncbi:MAG: flagellar basal body-associated FliL family protein [bacterium]